MKHHRTFGAGRGLRDQVMQTLVLPIMRGDQDPETGARIRTRVPWNQAPDCPNSTLRTDCGSCFLFSQVALLVKSYL